jgi:(R,R)-butanediol dehydrogenase / meso-butanediol dehydrogenase / diacetyl reductase
VDMMRGAVYHGRQDVRIEQLPIPEPRPGEVLLRVAYCGVCGSDLHEYYDGPVFIPTSPHPRTGHSAPGVFGHEFAGTVAALGAGVTGVEVGARVTVDPVVPCDACAFCRRGEVHRCGDIAILGNAGGPGGLAEYTRVPARQLVPLPDGVSLEEGALAEPLAVAEHGVSRLGRIEAEAALVVGAGPIGLAAALALRDRGVARIVIAELSDIRRAAAERLGLELLAAATEEVFPVVVECAGREASMTLAVDRLAVGGSLLVIAMNPRPVPVALNRLNVKEANVYGTHLSTRADFETVVDRMRRAPLDLAAWVEITELDDVVATMGSLREGRLIKALVRVS